MSKNKNIKVKQKNLWNTFYDWLFDGNKDSILDKSITKSITQKFILSRFSLNYRLTEILNEIFNDINIIYILDNMQFCKFIKELVIKKRINKGDIVYTAIDKHIKTNKALEKFPHLKDYEINNLLRFCQGDPEEEILLYHLDLVKDQKIKSPKSKIKKNTISMKDWIKNFNYE